MKKIVLLLIDSAIFSCAAKKIEQAKVDVVETVKKESEYMTISEDEVTNEDDINNIECTALYNY